MTDSDRLNNLCYFILRSTSLEFDPEDIDYIKLFKQVIEQYPSSYTDKFVLMLFNDNTRDKIRACTNNKVLVDQLVELAADYLKRKRDINNRRDLLFLVEAIVRIGVDPESVD